MATKRTQSGLGTGSPPDLRADGLLTVGFVVLAALSPLVLVADLLPRSALFGLLGVAAVASGLVAVAGAYEGYRWFLR